MKKIIQSLLKTFNLRLQRIPTDIEVEVDETFKKYKWIDKYNIDKVVDIGANDGHFASHVSRVFNSARFFCFEPIPSVFANLKKKFSDNKLFSFYNVALGEKEAKDYINHNEYSPSSSILEMEKLHQDTFEFTKNAVKQEIVINTLDGFLEVIQPDRTTFVKIDVQGYELKVLQGGQSFMRKCKVVVIEMSFEKLYKDQPLFHEVYSELNKLGFDYHGNIDQLHNPSNHEILQADCLFVNRNL